MRLLLSCFPKLQQFSFEDGSCTRGLGGEFVPREFAGMLQPFKDTLQVLKIDEKDSQEVQPDNGWEYPMPAGTLTSFTALKCLTIERRMLFGKAGDVLAKKTPAQKAHLPLPGGSTKTEREPPTDRQSDDEGEGKDGRVRLVDAIPKCLVTLKLNGCHIEDVLEDLAELAARKDEVAPMLDQISFGGLATSKPRSNHGAMPGLKNYMKIVSQRTSFA